MQNIKEFEEYYAKCVEIQKQCSIGEFAVMTKYWILYVRIIGLIQQVHFVINTNNYYLCLETWKELMALRFPMKKQNYEWLQYILSNTDGVTGLYTSWST